MDVHRATRIAHVGHGGQILPATGGFVSSGIPGHLAGIAESFNPEHAQRLLTETGYPNGHNFPLIIWRV